MIGGRGALFHKGSGGGDRQSSNADASWKRQGLLDTLVGLEIVRGGGPNKVGSGSRQDSKVKANVRGCTPVTEGMGEESGRGIEQRAQTNKREIRVLGYRDAGASSRRENNRIRQTWRGQSTPADRSGINLKRIHGEEDPSSRQKLVAHDGRKLPDGTKVIPARGKQK